MHLLIPKSTYQSEKDGSDLSFYGFSVGQVGQSTPLSRVVSVFVEGTSSLLLHESRPRIHHSYVLSPLTLAGMKERREPIFLS